MLCVTSAEAGVDSVDSESEKYLKMRQNPKCPVHALLASLLVKRPYGLPSQQARTLQLAEQYR